MSKILKLQVHVSEATGRVYWIDENGRAHLDPHQPEPVEEREPWEYDGDLPTCRLCDGVGHGYPGGGPCPLEERGGWDYE